MRSYLAFVNEQMMRGIHPSTPKDANIKSVPVHTLFGGSTPVAVSEGYFAPSLGAARI
jgi:hypothetical protein